MLYALLVEGQGPLGSVFSADEFTDREVRDTDGDGLPEFVDAWGEPLQFYRWPILYRSNLQKGLSATPGSRARICGPIEAREQNPLDPNQQLVAPSWWSANPASPAHATSLEYQGPCVSNPLPSPGGAACSCGPDDAAECARSGIADRPTHQRRAYFTKFLIVSSGPDRELGIGRCATCASTSLTPDDLRLENQAAQAILNGRMPPASTPSIKNRIRPSRRRNSWMPGWTTSPTTTSCPPAEGASDEGHAHRGGPEASR